MTQINNKGSAFTYEDMVVILKSYHSFKNRVKLLEYELSNDKPILTRDDVIYQMALSDLSLNNNDNIPYSTDHIALTYAQRADRVNIRHREELYEEINLLKAQTERLEYYVDLLDDRQSTIIKQMYFEGKTLIEIASFLRVSESTVKNGRRAGVKKLIEMYAFVSC